MDSSFLDDAELNDRLEDEVPKFWGENRSMMRKPSEKSELSLSGVDGEDIAIAFPVTHILVPQGAEYQAVCRGLANVPAPPQVQAIPIGIKGLVTDFLQDNFLSQVSPASGVVLMGLAGGLAPDLSIGDRLLYEGCYDSTHHWEGCDVRLRKKLAHRLQGAATLIQGLTCDRIISQARAKAELYQRSGLVAVDMEGYDVLKILNAAQIPTAIVRVISDTHQQTLPDLTPAIAADGNLNPWLLGWQFTQHPIAAFHLIRSSLLGLKKLQFLTQQLFQA